MQKVLIDQFTVPEESRAAFLGVSRTIHEILKALPGFIEGFVYERREGSGPFNVITTAVWKDGEAFDAAKGRVAQELQALGVNPAEKMRALNVQLARGVYERTSY